MDILLFNKSHFASELESLGHRVLVAAHPSEANTDRFDSWSLSRVDVTFENHDSLESILAKLPATFKPAAFVYHDDSHPFIRVEGFERSSLPLLFYQVDAHVHSLWFPKMTRLATVVWVAQRDYLSYYTKCHPHVTWVPLWAPVIGAASGARPINACFRGNLEPGQRSQRIAFFNNVREFVDVDVAAGPFQEVYSRTRIVLNESIGDDLNFRIFESLASGAMLLTPRVNNGLTELFRDGVHLVTYERNNVHDASQKISYYLAHENQRAAIAAAGYTEVVERHTPQARAKQLEETLIAASTLTPAIKNSSALLSAAYRLVWASRVEHRALSTSEGLKVLALLQSVLQEPESHSAESADPAMNIRAVLQGWEDTLPYMLVEVLRVCDLVQLPQMLIVIDSALKRLPQIPVLKLLAVHVANTCGQFDAARAFAALIPAELDAILALLPKLLADFSRSSPFCAPP